MHQFGLNQLTEAARPGFLSKLWDQLNNFVVILLIVASIISALLGEWVDAAAIMAIVVLNCDPGDRPGKPRRGSPGGAQENGRP